MCEAKITAIQGNQQCSQDDAVPHAHAYAQRSCRLLQHLGHWQRQTRGFAIPLLCDAWTGCQLRGKDNLGTLWEHASAGK